MRRSPWRLKRWRLDEPGTTESSDRFAGGISRTPQRNEGLSGSTMNDGRAPGEAGAGDEL